MKYFECKTSVEFPGDTEARGIMDLAISKYKVALLQSFGGVIINIAKVIGK